MKVRVAGDFWSEKNSEITWLNGYDVAGNRMLCRDKIDNRSYTGIEAPLSNLFVFAARNGGAIYLVEGSLMGDS